MMVDEFRKVLKERMETDDDWAYEVGKCWKQEVEILSRNMNETIDFLLNDCTEDEFSWISEVCEEVTEKTKSADFVKALHFLAEKYPEETEKYNIMSFINTCDLIL